MRDPLQSLFVLGSSHHEAPLEIRESITLSADAAEKFRDRLLVGGGLRECLVVNTCNRLEIYGLAEDGITEDQIRARVCAQAGIDPALFERHSFWHTNLAVLQHALEVSAGIDSQMVGETEIAGQMKDAYAAARDAGSTGPILNRVFQKCFQAAKSARSQTAIGRGQISIGNIAADLAGRIFGRLGDSRTLLVGSGEVAERTAKALMERGAGDITVSSRRFERAKQLAHDFGGAVVEFANCTAHLGLFDIVISSTAARHSVIGADCVREAMRRRPERPLFLLDLAVPRDIAPEAASADNVYLYNLDDLAGIANENLAQRKAEIEHARAILKAHAWRLWLQLRRRTLLPTS